MWYIRQCLFFNAVSPCPILLSISVTYHICYGILYRLKTKTFHYSNAKKQRTYIQLNEQVKVFIFPHINNYFIKIKIRHIYTAHYSFNSGSSVIFLCFFQVHTERNQAVRRLLLSLHKHRYAKSINVRLENANRRNRCPNFQTG